MPRLSGHRRHTVSIVLNGRETRGTAESRMLLSDMLRHELGATGTHVGCEHGVCGACTVHLDGRAVRSCLTLAIQADGRRVDTIEGVAGGNDALGPIQRAFKKHFALQCGFCTPGIVMSLSDYLGRHGEASEAEIRDLLGGHLCRCTGYTPIVRAAMEAAEEMKIQAEDIEDA